MTGILRLTSLVAPSTRLRRITYLLIIVVSLLPQQARAQYILDSGDVLELSLFGAADFKRRVTVNVDGDVSVPFLGELRAAGLSLPDLRKKMVQQLVASGVVRNPDLTIELVEHRPFYISGDVSKPGAYPYRPGLTVRHAVALAGGYDALRFRTEHPLLAMSDLRGQHESLWAELVKRQARIASLKAEMQGSDEVVLDMLKDAPVPPPLIAQISDLETRDLKLRLEKINAQKESFQRAATTADAAVAMLEEAIQQQKGSLDQQVAASALANAVHAKGFSANARLNEENRALAILKIQEVDLMARLIQARKDREDVTRQLDHLVADHRQRLVRELQEGAVELEKVRAQIRATSEKLLYTGAVKAQLQRSGQGLEVIIHRKKTQERVQIPATEDAEVQPGDVLDIVIRPEVMAAPSE